MNNIGFGILCFGDKKYFKGAKEKQRRINQAGFDCVVLTDNPANICGDYIYYDRSVKSYHDKMMLVPQILEDHDICIIMDADIHINDFSFLYDLKEYEFKKGISYLDTLYNHPEQKFYNWELNLRRPEWFNYDLYARKIFPNFRNLRLIWEYFLIFNPDGDLNNFYKTYEELQIIKESCDLNAKKDIVGYGEGVSIMLSAKVNKIPCEWDKRLYATISHKMSIIG